MKKRKVKENSVRKPAQRVKNTWDKTISYFSGDTFNEGLEGVVVFGNQKIVNLNFF